MLSIKSHMLLDASGENQLISLSRLNHVICLFAYLRVFTLIFSTASSKVHSLSIYLKSSLYPTVLSAFCFLKGYTFFASYSQPSDNILSKRRSICSFSCSRGSSIPIFIISFYFYMLVLLIRYLILYISFF